MGETNYRDLLQSILNWADDHQNFDSSFIETLFSKFIENPDHDLTTNQKMAVDNIIDRWHIDLEDY